MSDESHDKNPAVDHVPHVLPLLTYLKTWGVLLVLTAITVAVSYADLGAGNIVVALLVATIKATTVAMFFMHLAFDHKFHALIFSFSLVVLAIFIVFTMFDTENRGRADTTEGDRPMDVTMPFKEKYSEARLREQAFFAPGLVAGRVVDAASSQGLPGLTVSCAGGGATTGDDGSFVVGRLASGRAICAVYDPCFPATTVPVDVKSGARTDVTLTVARLAELGVLVTGPGGKPVADVELVLEPERQTTRSDSAGRALFTCLPAAPQTVVAKAAGFAPATAQVAVPATGHVDVKLSLSAGAP